MTIYDRSVRELACGLFNRGLESSRQVSARERRSAAIPPGGPRRRALPVRFPRAAGASARIAPEKDVGPRFPDARRARKGPMASGKRGRGPPASGFRKSSRMERLFLSIRRRRAASPAEPPPRDRRSGLPPAGRPRGGPGRPPPDC